MHAEDHIHLSPYLSFMSGALAGCAATVGSYPFDLLRTILASQGEPKVYLSIYIYISYHRLLKKITVVLFIYVYIDISEYEGCIC